MKKIVRNIHLWLGLFTGLILFLVCLSGALLSFTEEALNLVNKKYLYVQKSDKKRSKIEDVIHNYESANPEEKIFLINTYREENRSYDFFSATKTGQKDEKGNDLYGNYKMVYANPYTSEIIRVDKGTLETIVILVQIHTNLLAGKYGNYVIKLCTFIFLIQLIAGLWLWFPKSDNAKRTAYKIKLNAGTKRLNYDLHRTIGFYTSGVLLVLVITGLIMAWRFIKDPLIDSLGGKSELLEKQISQPQRLFNVADYSYNAIYEELITERPLAQQVTFFMPESDTITVINGTTADRPTFLNFETGKYFQFNRYNGKPTGGKDLKFHQKNSEIEAATLLIHMGFWGGITTKILTFIFGILGASLPVTGLLIWWGRNRKKNEKRNTNTAGSTQSKSIR